MPSRTVWLLSLGLHGLLFASLPSKVELPAIEAFDEIDVTFDVVPPVAASSAPDPDRERSPSPPGRVASTSSTAPVTALRSLARRVPPAQSPSVAATDEVAMALDPKTAASAFLLAAEQQSSDGSASESEPSKAERAAAPSYFEGVGTKRYLTKRDPPVLKRDRDGSYRYRGHAFRATIESDGSVAFDDRYQQGLPVVFDLTDAVLRRRGEDPYRAEKEWFLEGTEDLRGELLEQWRRKNLERALRKLVGQLRRISEDDTISPRQKADRILALYRDTNDGKAGVAARDAIAAFVAEEHPELSLPER